MKNECVIEIPAHLRLEYLIHRPPAIDKPHEDYLVRLTRRAGSDKNGQIGAVAPGRTIAEALRAAISALPDGV